ncbi:MAG: hypothetical protein HC939_16155 [Pleurocapsa sp. SU_5_0]|nr:hypothetical protein [Pleurocapsa sp. SU_5_0]NJR47988.1 hypothetical protein [Hyellaceae cyanobacterium CSU_1_1]
MKMSIIALENISENLGKPSAKVSLKQTIRRSITFLRRSLYFLGLVLSLICFSSFQAAQAATLTAASPAIHAGEHYSAITTPEQALMYWNSQNLVNTWNNIIIQAKTGDEQLQLMRQSGIFADDVQLTFDFGDQKIVLNGLDSPEAHEFYNSFVNPLKKNRYNIASNVEAVKFEQDSLRFNFKHFIFFNDHLSVVGEDQATTKRIGDRYQIASAVMRIIYFDVANGY